MTDDSTEEREDVRPSDCQRKHRGLRAVSAKGEVRMAETGLQMGLTSASRQEMTREQRRAGIW